ncbi:MAG TPA: hypothetical protein VEQ37_04600 [Actinomycetota bacterium]|nr:hypothetical protein [Actinomycetota bacterium]
MPESESVGRRVIIWPPLSGRWHVVGNDPRTRASDLWGGFLNSPRIGSTKGGHDAGRRAEASNLGVHLRRWALTRSLAGDAKRASCGFATKREAKSALHEYIRYLETRGDPCPERIELAAYLGRWLEYQRVRGTRARTLEAYEGFIRREIVPLIGRIELADLRPRHVRAVLLKMAKMQVGMGFRIAKTSDAFLSFGIPSAPYLPPKASTIAAG